MTMKEKIEGFSDEQIVQLMTIKDEAELDKFLVSVDIHMEDEQKTQMMEYIKTGKIDLSDEEMENVAGGFIIGLISSAVTKVVKVAQGYEKQAKAEGRPIRVEMFNKGFQMAVVSDPFGFLCLTCGKIGCTFAKSARPTSITANYFDCKCYACGKLSPEIIMKS